MENYKDQIQRKGKPDNDKETLEESLPKEDSPYLQNKDLEDYKKKGYGTQGHLEPKPGRSAGGASTDAPTLSGGSVTSDAEVSATETINRQGVP
ncbi:hypothetical protein L484_009425 [Morus notabilis]|uniref:Late embryogenesis abundant protein, LEA-18 n=1 Tax=Morus notabilis TaxID=981085 RepID=W9QD18_9ROSA|nr:hypothetical protein L484_009425 [Morus notabilis]